MTTLNNIDNIKIYPIELNVYDDNIKI